MVRGHRFATFARGGLLLLATAVGCGVLVVGEGNIFAQGGFGSGLQGGLSSPMWSKPGPGERDTAASGGQAGGQKLGRGYQLETLRCPTKPPVVIPNGARH